MLVKRRITCCKCRKRLTAVVEETVKRGQAMCGDCEREAAKKAKEEENRKRAEAYRKMTFRPWWIEEADEDV